MSAVLSETTPISRQHAALSQARERLRNAQARYAAVTDELARYESIAANKASAVESAIAAENDVAVAIEDAPALAQRRRDAEAQIAAADRQVGRARKALSEHTEEVAAAQRALETAVADLLTTETEEIAERFLTVFREAQRLGAIYARYPSVRFAGDDTNVPVNELQERAFFGGRQVLLQHALKAVFVSDDLHIPINERLGSAQQPSLYETRRRALLAGETIQPISELLK
jgi:hypothetical protein